MGGMVAAGEGVRASARLVPRTAKLRANGLLDMMYTPAELADELGLDQRDIYRRLIPAGMPHERDDNGHIWLHGPTIAQWMRSLGGKRPPLGPGQGYCLRCRAAVEMVNPTLVRRGRFNILQAPCPICGATVSRGVRHDDGHRQE